MNLSHALDVRAQQVRHGEQALSLINGERPLYLFGTTSYAARVAAARGDRNIVFIDDRRAGGRFQGAPVVPLAEVPADAAVIGCVVEGRPKTVDRLLRTAGFVQAWDYYQLNAADPVRFPVPFWSNNVPDIEGHADAYAWLRGLLDDEASERELDDLLYFRYTNDPRAGSLTYRLQDQYWEPFLDLASIRSFVDGGSFDGRTALQFIQRQPAYERVDVFEPFPLSMADAQRTLQGFERTFFHLSAILDRSTTLRFTSGAGSANGLSAEGDIEVRTCALDAELAGVRVGMLKLDIEGAEPEAIAGARHLIAEQRPVIAVCVYHDQSHFWRIPEQVLAIRPDYRVRLRHYSEGVYETVMYFF